MASGTAVKARQAQRAVLLACAGAVTLAAWLWLLGRPAHHHESGWRSFASLVAMWQAMMVAMMTPAVLDWLFTFAALAQRAWSAAWFASGYFVVWLGYSILAALLQTAIGHDRLPARAGGAVLIATGLLYFTPFQRACLTHCRNPVTYFLARWHNGPRSGFGFGLTHGAYCVGCCWMLMLTGFAVGVMNILWMALLTLLICVEKLAPHGDRIGAVAAVAMTLWGVALLF
jgi:predicted metal-binding membrane protein